MKQKQSYDKTETRIGQHKAKRPVDFYADNCAHYRDHRGIATQ